MRTDCPAGMYLVDADQRDRVVAGTGSPALCPVAVLDGKVSGSREGFFAEIARAMRFPDYFGRNWDAVYDCLTDPGLFPDTGVVLVVDGFERFANAEPEQWEIARKVFEDACAFWRPLGRPFYVLLFGAGEPLTGMPAFSVNCLDAASRGEVVDPPELTNANATARPG